MYLKKSRNFLEFFKGHFDDKKKLKILKKVGEKLKNPQKKSVKSLKIP